MKNVIELSSFISSIMYKVSEGRLMTNSNQFTNVPLYRIAKSLQELSTFSPVQQSIVIISL